MFEQQVSTPAVTVKARYGHEQMFLNKSKSIFSGPEPTDCESRAIQLDRFSGRERTDCESRAIQLDLFSGRERTDCESRAIQLDLFG